MEPVWLMRRGIQMKNYEKIIDKHFEAFMETKKKYSEVRITYPKWLFRMEYITHFTDEFDATGYIYYKPAFCKYGRLYMFKGKPFNSKPYPRIAFFNIPGHIQAMVRDFRRSPERDKKNKAEWRAFFHFCMNSLKVVIVALPIVIPFIMTLKK